MWATEYHDVVVITIADAKGESCAFSADTSMAEYMVVATKGKNRKTGRGAFISLNQCPRSLLEALEVVNNTYRLDSIRRLEDEPSGGDPIKVGDKILGYVLNCPLWVDKAWEAVRIKEMALIQSAYRLANGEMWLPTQGSPLEIPICLVGDIVEVGATDRDIREKSERGAFDVEKVTRIPKPGRGMNGRKNLLQMPTLDVRCLSDEFGRPLKIDVKTLIGENSEVIVSPHAEKWLTRTLELIVKRYRYQFPVNRSRLLDPPV